MVRLHQPSTTIIIIIFIIRPLFCSEFLSSRFIFFAQKKGTHQHPRIVSTRASFHKPQQYKAHKEEQNLLPHTIAQEKSPPHART
jgi:hypothetical protein